MITDLMKNIGNYPRCSEIARFMETHDLSGYAAGKYIISDDAFLMISEYLTNENNDCKFEGHRNYIDVQIVARGEEYLLIQRKEECALWKEYDAEKDVIFYTARTWDKHLLSSDHFAVLFPEDLHKPGLAADKSAPVRKYVFKIRCDEEDKANQDR